MRILAIETSCDETALAVLEANGDLKNPHFSIHVNQVASQIKLHAKFGGVVPSLAKREHLKNLPILFNKIFKSKNKKNKIDIKSIDLIAVTVGPGLEPALWTGIIFAKEIHKKYFNNSIPLIGTSHLEGHLFSFLLSQPEKINKIFPAIGLIVSGGHTNLILLESLKKYKKLGETLDDAIGESFDKVARLLNLPYPGGPELEKLALKGNPRAINFPSPMIGQKNYNFSYSGLKTSVLYYLKKLGSSANDFSLTKNQKQILKKIESQGNLKADIAASFQYAALNVVANKSVKAIKEFGANSIIIGGGVSANQALRKTIKEKIIKEKANAELIVPPFSYCLDNGAMIAVAGYISYLKKKNYPLEAQGVMDI